MNQLDNVFKNKKLMEIKKNLSQNPKLGVSEKYNRKLYDKAHNLKKTKKCYFDIVEKQKNRKKTLSVGKKTNIDWYTGKTLHANNKAAICKYGNKAAQEHIASVDHIVSLKQFHSKVKYNPFLSDDDVKNIANSNFNYRVTNFHLNTQKGEKSNIEIALDPKTDANMAGRVKLVSDQAYAETRLGIATAAYTTKNIGLGFGRGAINAINKATIPLIVASVQSLCLVAQGEKDLKTATKDMGAMAMAIGVSGGGQHIVVTGIQGVLRNSESTMLKSIAKSNVVSNVVLVAYMLKDSTIRFINGEIDGEQLFSEVGQKGVELVAATVGAIAGEALIPIPIVGPFVGAMIVSVVCGSVYDFLQTAKFDYHNEKLTVVSAIANEALEEMGRQREILSSLIGNENSKWNTQITTGFADIFSGANANNVEKIANGLDRILSLFKTEVKFKTFKEFEDFFMDENAVLKL